MSQVLDRPSIELDLETHEPTPVWMLQVAGGERLLVAFESADLSGVGGCAAWTRQEAVALALAVSAVLAGVVLAPLQTNLPEALQHVRGRGCVALVFPLTCDVIPI